MGVLRNARQESEPEEHEAPVEIDDVELLHNVDVEVATAVTLLNLPEDSDSESSGDSDFKYDYM